MSGYYTYVTYMALKQHFTTDKYDFIKYDGKIRTNVNTYEKRKDRFFFAKLSKKRDCENIMLSNMIVNPKIWVGDLLSPEANDIYINWLRRQESLTYIVSNNMDELNDNFDSNFIVKDGQYPVVINKQLKSEIEIETLVILTKLVGCLEYWDRKISDTIFWPTIRRLIVKYEPFIKYDLEKIRKIVVNKFDSNE